MQQCSMSADYTSTAVLVVQVDRRHKNVSTCFYLSLMWFILFCVCHDRFVTVIFVAVRDTSIKNHFNFVKNQFSSKSLRTSTVEFIQGGVKEVDPALSSDTPLNGTAYATKRSGFWPEVIGAPWVIGPALYWGM